VTWISSFRRACTPQFSVVVQFEYRPSKKDRLAAVSPKSDQAFGSDGCDGSSALPLSAPAEQTQRTEAGGKNTASRR